MKNPIDEKTMDDYIGRKAAIHALGERPMTWTDSDYELGSANQYDVDRLAIETVPSGDVQPVVRCKDCKWCADADGLMCKNEKSWVVATEPSFGCVYGKRKDGDTDG